MFDVLLITGGAGAGKTSTAHGWATSRRGVTAHLSHDALLLLVKSGLASPAENETPEAERQWRVAIDVCVAATRIYTASRMRCAIDTFLLPAHLELWRGLADLRVGLVVLQPAVEVAVARNAARFEQTGWGVPAWQVRANHAAMRAWDNQPHVVVLDTSMMDPAHVLAAIDAWEEGMEHGGSAGQIWRFTPKEA